MIYSILSILVPVCTGYLLVSLLFRSIPTNKNIYILKLCLAGGLGVGVSSILYFIWLIVFGSGGRGILLAESSLLICILLIYLYGSKHAGTSLKIPSEADSSSVLRSSYIVTIGFYAILVLSITEFFFMSIRNPHGGWDAISMWNYRAVSLFHASDWKEVFSDKFAIAIDYPLLLPGFIARSWDYIGTQEILVPCITSFLFIFGTVGLLYSSLSIMRSKTQALLAGIVLLGTARFIIFGASQSADVPISFFLLAVVVLICLSDVVYEKRYELIFLSGLMAGMSAWTKNEGIMFILAIILSRLAIHAYKRQWFTYLKDLIVFILGALPVLLVLVYFKSEIGAPNHIMADQSFEYTASKLLDFSRYIIVAKVFLSKMYYFNHFVLGICIVLIMYMSIFGIKINKNQLPGLVTSVLTLSMITVGYFLVFIISPHPLRWHAETSVARLLVQLWPSFIFVYFMIVSTPEQAFLKTGQPQKI